MPSAIGNLFMKAIVNSPLHPLLGSNIAVITVEGRKTGKRYSTPVNTLRDGDAFTVVSLRSRTWWRNLRGERLAALRVSGKNYAVRGEVIEKRDEVAAGLAQYFRQRPNYARFFSVRLAADGRPDTDDLQRAADERVIIRLVPVAGQ